MLRGVGHEFIYQKANRLDFGGGHPRFVPGNLDLPFEDARQIGTKSPKEGDARYFGGLVRVEVSVHLSDCRNAVCGGFQVTRRIGDVGGAALHRQQAGDELQAVHDAMIDFLSHELRLRNGAERRQPQLHLVHHYGGKVHEIVDLILLDGAGHPVDDAKRAQVVSVTGSQRRAHIKAKPEFARDQGIGERTRVSQRITENVGFVGQNGRRA